MLTNVKTWLDTTGYKVAEDRFLHPLALPYIVFSVSCIVSGADSKNCIADRDVSIELYAERIDPVAESTVENLLDAKGIPYTKERIWIETETFFQTLYGISLIEKL